MNTIEARAAHYDLQKYGQLHENHLLGGFVGTDSPEAFAHPFKAIQQLVSDGLAKPAEFVESPLGFFTYTKVYPIQ